MTRQRLHPHRVLTKAEKQKRWRLKHLEEVRAYQQTYRAKNKEALAAKEQARRDAKSKLFLVPMRQKPTTITESVVAEAVARFTASGGVVQQLPAEIVPENRRIGSFAHYDIGE